MIQNYKRINQKFLKINSIEIISKKNINTYKKDIA
jgi:hypothetical protein